MYHRYTYAYDKAGNRITQKDERLWTPAGNSGWELFGNGIMPLDMGYHYDCTSTNYLYDKANRLTMTSAETFYDQESTGKKIVRYVFDGAGNQISTAAEFLTPATSNTEAYGLNSEKYDSVVEVTINEYNGLNQLVNTTNIKDGTRTFASYVYNGDGLRVQKTVDGTITNYTYSGSYIIAETGKTYLRGLSYHAVTQSGTKYYYFSNAHGDITNVVNSSKVTVAAYDYDEFGNLTEEVGTFESSFRYAGEYYDVESGNYYLRSRYYDPTIGRFTQQDSFLGYDDNPLSLNRYTYCHNNPIRFVDPSGHEARTYSRGDIIYGYDTSQFTSSEQDYQSSVWMGKYERGEINSEQFIRGMNSIGITMSVAGGRIGGYSGENSQPSNFIPAEAVAVIFNEQLSYENSLSAASLFDSYNAGIIDDEGLKQQLNELSAMAIVYNETNYDIYDKETYEPGRGPTSFMMDGILYNPTSDFPNGEIIVVSGGKYADQSVDGHEKSYKYNFIEPAIKKIKDLRAANESQEITWCISNFDWSEKDIDNFKKAVKDMNVNVVLFDNKDELINYINYKNTDGKGERGSQKITEFIVFSHGNPGALMFGFDYKVRNTSLDLTTEDVARISPDAFDHAVSHFYSCNTATETDGSISFAQAWSNTTNGYTYAVVGQTTYAKMNDGEGIRAKINRKIYGFNIDGSVSLPTIVDNAKRVTFTPNGGE